MAKSSEYLQRPIPYGAVDMMIVSPIRRSSLQTEVSKGDTAPCPKRVGVIANSRKDRFISSVE